MEREAFLSTWCRIFLHTGEKDVPTPQEGPFHVMFVRNQHIEEQKELNT